MVLIDSRECHASIGTSILVIGPGIATIPSDYYFPLWLCIGCQRRQVIFGGVRFWCVVAVSLAVDFLVIRLLVLDRVGAGLFSFG